jgi:caffeoyl-CoA O-methyltransferase
MRPVTPISIAAAELDRLFQQFQQAPEADAAMLRALRDVRDLVAGLDPYLSLHTTPESKALADLSARTQRQDWTSPSAHGHVLEQEMLSGHIEGQFLKMLVHATKARHVLDIGMFTGYSALAMAEALPADGCVVACELDDDVANLARESFAHSAAGSKIDVRVGPALKTLQQLARDGRVFELVFIDADKAGYAGYVDELLESDLLAAHALVCVDNTLMQGIPWSGGPATANGEAIAAFNRTLAADSRVEQVVIPLRDGITLIRRAT